MRTFTSYVESRKNNKFSDNFNRLCESIVDSNISFEHFWTTKVVPALKSGIKSEEVILENLVRIVEDWSGSKPKWMNYEDYLKVNNQRTRMGLPPLKGNESQDQIQSEMSSSGLVTPQQKFGQKPPAPTMDKKLFNQATAIRAAGGKPRWNPDSGTVTDDNAKGQPQQASGQPQQASVSRDQLSTLLSQAKALGADTSKIKTPQQAMQVINSLGGTPTGKSAPVDPNWKQKDAQAMQANTGQAPGGQAPGAPSANSAPQPGGQASKPGAGNHPKYQQAVKMVGDRFAKAMKDFQTGVANDAHKTNDKYAYEVAKKFSDRMVQVGQQTLQSAKVNNLGAGQQNAMHQDFAGPQRDAYNQQQTAQQQAVQPQTQTVQPNGYSSSISPLAKPNGMSQTQTVQPNGYSSSISPLAKPNGMSQTTSMPMSPALQSQLPVYARNS